MEKFQRVLLFFVFIVLLYSTAYCQEIFSDTFSGDNDTRPSQWRIIGAPEKGYWYLQDGQFVTGNGDEITTVSGYSFAILNIPASKEWSDYKIKTDFWMPQKNGRLLLLGRWQDENNTYEAIVDIFEGHRTLAITRVLNGTRTILTNAINNVGGVSIPTIEGATLPTDTHTLEFTLSGQNLSLSLDGTEYVKITDTSFRTGTVGLGERYDLVAFDNFVVASPGAVLAPSSAAPISIPSEISPAAQGYTQPPSESGSQMQGVPSTVEGGGSVYTLVLGQNLDKDSAKKRKTNVDRSRVISATIVEKNGKYDVYAGNFSTEDEANKAKATFEKEGFVVKSIAKIQSGSRQVTRAAQPKSENYRVLIAEFRNLTNAENLKNELEANGYLVSIEKLADVFQVLIGNFKERTEAQILCDSLVKSGYALSKVIATYKSGRDVISTTVTITPAEAETKIKTAAVGLTDEQRQEIIKIIQLQQKTKESDTTAKDILILSEKVKKLAQQQQEVLNTLREKDEQEKQKMASINRLLTKVNMSMDQRNWNDALAAVDEVLKIDPHNGLALLKRNAIINLRDNTSPTTRDEVEKLTQENTKREALTLANQYFSSGQYREALVQYKYIHDKLNVKDAFVLNRINECEKEIASEKSKAKNKDLLLFILMGGIVSVIVIIIILILYSIIRARKRDRELLRQVQELTVRPLLDLTDEKIQQQIEQLQYLKSTLPEHRDSTQRPSRAKPEISPRAASAGHTVPESTLPSDEDFMPEPEIDTSYISKEPTEYIIPEDKVSRTKQPLRPIVPTTDVSKTKKEEKPKVPPPPERPKVPEPPPAPIPTEEFSLENLESVDELDMSLVNEDVLSENRDEVSIPEFNIDDVLSEDISDEISMEDTVESILPSDNVVGVSTNKEDTSKEDTSVNIVKPPVEKPTEKPVQPQVPPPHPPPPKIQYTTDKMKQLHFRQDFDDEAVGQMPINWEGEYSFASLVVSDSTPAYNSDKCMRFEKLTGSGSAYYFRKFPDISGKIGIEFDIRCNDKNKYLLGFYIEKDEDFRQSIHTIIHKTESNAAPSIRIHGEPVAYEFGKWAHIKYEIDLIEGVINGYLDGNLVAENVRMAIKPTSINTLSIRDNLATTGILLIDNIKIYNL